MITAFKGELLPGAIRRPKMLVEGVEVVGPADVA